ncbi:CHAD domain-containing protein [Thiomicrorhabdus aquaedulcis]|uniref:CHAD domain-containing protein n=1 Tax=Thiomicrorhabdus aquaedulcis TaxID=2211106 RepID=UPI001562BBBA|nr:CHAD domain-containing protein [Thiomicrorhabdus aquaedulcis]
MDWINKIYLNPSQSDQAWSKLNCDKLFKFEAINMWHNVLIKGENIMNKHLKSLAHQVNDYLKNDNKADAKKALTVSIEKLHDLRVATRKWLAVMNPDDEMVASFKKIIQASNKVRDMDVFLWEILPTFPESWQADLVALQAGLQDSRAELNSQFKVLLETELVDELVRAKKRLVKHAHAFESAHGRHKMPFKEIEKRLKTAVKELKLLDLEDKQLHKIRLLIKRLRYQLEHFYPEEHKALALTETIQERLGLFHDQYQAMNLLDKHQSLLTPHMFEQTYAFLQHEKQRTISALRQFLTK